MRLRRLTSVTAVTALAGLFAFSGVDAAAPFAKKQAPGYYRMMLGDFEVTSLNDGTAPLPLSTLLTNIAPAQYQQALKAAHLKDPVITSINGFLINTGTKLVLIDAGFGGLMGPALGRLRANLQASGYEPEQVDEIYITHMHGDHVGGLMAGEHRAFPNAIVRTDLREAQYWLNPTTMDAAGKDIQGMFRDAMGAVNPYVNAGKFKAFDGDTELVPGIRAVATHGHTPGHTIYMIESKGEKLVLLGDLMHFAAAQFPDPAVTIHFDTDSKAAAVQRQKAFAEAASQGYWVGAAHLSFPGLGHLNVNGKGYTWVPANYLTTE